MLAITALSFLVLIHQCIGLPDLTKLLKAHPTWSFEVESVETLLKNSASHLRGSESHLAMAELRSKIQATLGPKATHILKKVSDDRWPKYLPKEFDARIKWPGCSSLIESITDEGACINDGPVAVASIVSDRLCIYSNQTSKEKLSPEFLVGCTESCKNRPKTQQSFDYALFEGIPTGGSFNSKQGCLPYTQKPCKHTEFIYPKREGAKYEKVCHKGDAIEHKCEIQCSNEAYLKPLEQDLIKLKSWYTLWGKEHPIMMEMLTHGPVITGMSLFNDFFSHPEGVYKPDPSARSLRKDKFIKLIGWGEENNNKYWLAVNSWDKWGTSKVFKLARPSTEEMMLVSTADF